MSNPNTDLALTVKDAAIRCGVSGKTIRRRLETGKFPNAWRSDGPRPGLEKRGPWLIPTSDLLAAGLSFSVPKAVTVEPLVIVEAPNALRAEKDALAVEVAHLKELLRRADESLVSERRAMAMLTAGDPVSTSRRWFGRSKR